MRKFAYAAVFATAISAPVLVGALMDHSAVSVLGAPPGSSGPCSGNCSVGAAGNGGTNSGGASQGGHTMLGPISISGTESTGRFEIARAGSVSGNRGTIPIRGHCTGSFLASCS